MFKFILGATLLAFFMCVKEFGQTPITKPITKDEPITEVATPNRRAIVKYGNHVYDCENVVRTTCGYTIHCGNTTTHCVNDIDFEYIK